jgi:hypothetical protein
MVSVRVKAQGLWFCVVVQDARKGSQCGGGEFGAVSWVALVAVAAPKDHWPCFDWRLVSPSVTCGDM